MVTAAPHDRRDGVRHAEQVVGRFETGAPHRRGARGDRACQQGLHDAPRKLVMRDEHDETRSSCRLNDPGEVLPASFHDGRDVTGLARVHEERAELGVHHGRPDEQQHSAHGGRKLFERVPDHAVADGLVGDRRAGRHDDGLPIDRLEDPGQGGNRSDELRVFHSQKCTRGSFFSLGSQSPSAPDPEPPP